MLFADGRPSDFAVMMKAQKTVSWLVLALVMVVWEEWGVWGWSWSLIKPAIFCTDGKTCFSLTSVYDDYSIVPDVPGARNSAR